MIRSFGVASIMGLALVLVLPAVPLHAGETVIVENTISKAAKIGVGTFGGSIQSAWSRLLLRTTLIGDDVKIGPVDQNEDAEKGTRIAWSEVSARAPYTVWYLSERAEDYKLEGKEAKYDDVKHRMRSYFAALDGSTVDERTHAKIAGAIVSGGGGGGGNGGTGGGSAGRTPNWFSLAVDMDMDVDSNRNGVIAAVNQNDGEEAKAEEKVESSETNPIGAIAYVNRRTPIILRKLMEQVGNNGDLSVSSLLEGHLLIFISSGSAGQVQLVLPGTNDSALEDYQEKGDPVPKLQLRNDLLSRLMNGEDVKLDVVGTKTGALDLCALLGVRAKKSSAEFTECSDSVRITVAEEWSRLPLGGSLQMQYPAYFKVRVPTKHGGRLFIQTSHGKIEDLRCPDGKPYASGGDTDMSGDYSFSATCTNSYEVSCQFVQTGEASGRPWNGWYCPSAPQMSHKMYDRLGGFTPLRDYDRRNHRGTPRAYYADDKRRVSGVDVLRPALSRQQPLKTGTADLEWDAQDRKLRWDGGPWSGRIEEAATDMGYAPVRLQGNKLSDLLIVLDTSNPVLPRSSVRASVTTMARSTTLEWESRYHVGRLEWEGHCLGWSLATIARPIQFKALKDAGGNEVKDSDGFVVYETDAGGNMIPEDGRDLLCLGSRKAGETEDEGFTKWEMRALYSELADSRLSSDKFRSVFGRGPAGPVLETERDPLDSMVQQFHDTVREYIRVRRAPLHTNLRGREVKFAYLGSSTGIPGVSIVGINGDERRVCRIRYVPAATAARSTLRLDWYNESRKNWIIGTAVPIDPSRTIHGLSNESFGVVTVDVNRAALPVLSEDAIFRTSTDVWNHAAFRYKAEFKECPNFADPDYVEIRMSIICNSDAPFPPGDTGTEEKTYVYRITYSNGDTTSKRQNWVSCVGCLPPSGLWWFDPADDPEWFSNCGVEESIVRGL